MPRAISHLAEIVDDFDFMLLDQFGVLHDGHRAFPGAAACLDAVRELGKPVVALSNSGRRAASNIERLEKLGFARTNFVSVVTSGELARRRLEDMLAKGDLNPGDDVLLISREGDFSLLNDLDLRMVNSGTGARLVIIAGVTPEETSLEEYQALLKPLADKGIPAICANPDHVIYAGGKAAFGPAVVAADYGASGAPVFYLGKPGADMFAAGLAALGDPKPDRCLMVGDSPHHDIGGGKKAGCRTLLITSGIQSAQGENEITADYTMPAFIF
ncbi:TIGR01459 family HAD-type hydrolase [Roseibium sediminis]|uniref:TIGR01459 family HAD-type hydrolase n=1 Tax=Roseibium sediminis TaxID=1775174 RepID=UPI00123E44C7|nr:TIGR01459 family HAD-type hydrolase [Roseibium sediminis]